MTQKRFKITATADFGRDTFLGMVIGTMKSRQTNMIVHDLKSYVEADGRPFQNIARVEIPGDIDLETMKEWTLDCLRLYYGGPSFVLYVEEDKEPLPGDGGVSVISIS